MIELTFKTIACSGLFIAFYWLILQREKMFAFNRFYLLATLLLSFTIPFMELGINKMDNVPVVAEVIPVEIAKNDVILSEIVSQKAVETIPAVSEMNAAQPGFNWWILVPLVYMVLTLILLLRFISNLLNLAVITTSNERIRKQGFTIVSVKEDISTFSFFNYLFVSENEIKSERIQPEIFRHELAHIRQKHSIDVFLIEFLKVFFWFNPFLYMYKKSIQTNHEFLADAEVLNQNQDTVYYQQLLLKKITSKSQTALASPFNYLVTKKRFIMMTKKTSRLKTIALKLFSIPLLVLTMLVFSEKVSAQVQSGKGVSKELFREYKKQIRKATVKVKNADGTKTEKIETKNLDTELLAKIYNQMSDDQKLQVRPLPQSKNFAINLGNLGNLGDLGVNLGDMGIKIADEVLNSLNLNNLDFSEMEKVLNSPEFQKQIEKIEIDSKKIEDYFNSPEWNQKIKEIEKSAEEIGKKYGNEQTSVYLKKAKEFQEQAKPFYDQAQVYYKNAQPFYVKAQDIYKQARPYYEKAQPFYKKAQPYYQEAQKHYKKMLEHEKSGNTDLYKKEEKLYEKQMDLYTAEMDKYAEQMDLYGSVLDKYSDEMDVYGSWLDKYGQEMDKYGEKMDKYGEMMDAYGQEISKKL